MADARQIQVTVIAPSLGGHVLATGAGSPIDPFRLPTATLSVSDEERALEPIRAELAVALGLTAPVLEMDAPGSWGQLDEVAVLIVLDHTVAPPVDGQGLHSVPIASVDRSPVPAEIAARASTWLEEFAGRSVVPDLRAAWSRPGWLASVTDWLDVTLHDAGRRRIGPVEQVHMWGISALLRTETAAGAVWVKASFPPFRAEPGITRFLAQRFPSAVPHVLGSHTAEGWMALDDFGPDEVGERRSEAIGTAAVRLLVKLQCELANDPDALLRAGAVDRRLDRLADDLEAAFATDVPPVVWAQTPERMAELVRQVAASAADLSDAQVPDTLVHGDFHSWNVAVVDGRPVIFDWTDTAVGNPLVDFATWVGFVGDPTVRPAAWLAWSEAWADRLPRVELRDRYHQVLALGSAYQVVSFVAILRAVEPAVRSELASGATQFATLLDQSMTALLSAPSR